MLRPLILAVSLFAALPAAAQTDWTKIDIRTEQVAPGVAVLSGAGGNVAVSYGPDGSLLVDDQYAPLAGKLDAALAALGAPPVKWVIDTHWHDDHVGANGHFASLGAVVIAQREVRHRLATTQIIHGKPVGPAPQQALPTLTYDDAMTIYANGDTIHILHAPAAHTDGDTIVHWEKANVFHMGDLFFHRIALPFVDMENGGSAYGLLAAADRVLALADDRSVIVPGHGPLATRADLAAYRAMLADLIATVEKAKAEGRSLAEIQAAKPAAKYETKARFSAGDALIAAIYRSRKPG